jgi:hypothetical protein
MKKLLIFIIGFLIGTIVFMPKQELFFKVLEILHNKNIDIISKTEENPLFLKISDAKVYYLNLHSATIKEITVYPYILFNKIEAKNIKINLGDFKIKSLNITYIPFLNAKLTGKSNFGEFEGEANLNEIKIYIKNPSNKIKTFLKKDKKGYFYYEHF